LSRFLIDARNRSNGNLALIGLKKSTFPRHRSSAWTCGAFVGAFIGTRLRGVKILQILLPVPVKGENSGKNSVARRGAARRANKRLLSECVIII
jgi:hypothetical protein